MMYFHNIIKTNNYYFLNNLNVFRKRFDLTRFLRTGGNDDGESSVNESMEWNTSKRTKKLPRKYCNQVR